jgi:hypothetical protein
MKNYEYLIKSRHEDIARSFSGDIWNITSQKFTTEHVSWGDSSLHPASAASILILSYHLSLRVPSDIFSSDFATKLL